MTYYKVVRQVNGKNVSWLYDMPKMLQLTYEPGKVTRAMHGTMGVFIFSDLNEARRAASKLYPLSKIFECKPIGTVKKIRRGIDWITLPYLENKSLYKQAKRYLGNYRTLEFDSCCVVPAIELLKEVL